MTFWMLIDKHWDDMSTGVGLVLFGVFVLAAVWLMFREISR